MGIVYGVDVGDGSGVRSTATSYDDNDWYAAADPAWGDAPQPSLERLEAFAAIVNALAPFKVGELTGGRTVGEYAAGGSADVFDVSMLYVRDLIGEWGSTPITFVLPYSMMATTSWDLSVTAEPSVRRDNRVVPARHAGFEVDDWIAVGGFPVQSTGLVVDAKATTGIGRLSEIETFPEPRNVNLTADARWLPLDWSIDPFVTYWVPYSSNDPGPCKGLTVQEFKDEVVECRPTVQWKVRDFLPDGKFHVRPDASQFFSSEPGVNPTFLPKYEYYRSSGYVRSGAIGIRKGRHMWCDQVNWNAQEVTVVAVVVLHQPSAEWSGVLEVESSNKEQLEPFFGLRYHRSGVLGLWADSLLLSVPVDAGLSRPAQPIVVGLNIDMGNNTISMMSVDKDVKVQTTSLPHRYDNRSRLWLGRSPFGKEAASAMEILEVSYWTQRFGPGDLAAVLGEYDRMYGVTTS